MSRTRTIILISYPRSPPIGNFGVGQENPDGKEEGRHENYVEDS
jgi:hypothetical protein